VPKPTVPLRAPEIIQYSITKPTHRAHKFTLPGKSICPCDHLFLSLYFILFLFIFYFSILLYILSYFIVSTYTHLLFLLAVCPATLQPGPLHSCHTHKHLLFYPLSVVLLYQFTCCILLLLPASIPRFYYFIHPLHIFNMTYSVLLCYLHIVSFWL
jgi:hypothetical protein